MITDTEFHLARCVCGFTISARTRLSRAESCDQHIVAAVTNGSTKEHAWIRHANARSIGAAKGMVFLSDWVMKK